MATTESIAGTEQQPYVFFGPYTNPVTSLDETQYLLNNFANIYPSEVVDLDGAFLFDAFLRDSSSVDIFRAIKGAHGNIEDQFGHRLAGRIFEEIVTLDMRTRYALNHVVLSPLETFSFFCRVHSDRRVNISQDGLVFGIYGVTFPDNLILRNARNTWVLEAIVESKSGPRAETENIDRQLESYSRPFSLFTTYDIDRSQVLSKSLGRVLVDVRPDLDFKPLAIGRKGYEVVLAVPRGPDFVTRPVKRAVMPFSGTEFSWFFKALIADCSN